MINLLKVYPWDEDDMEVTPPVQKDFYKMTTFQKTSFKKNYSKTNFISRYFYTYALTAINSVNAKGGVVDLEDIEDMDFHPDIGQGEKDLLQFQTSLQASLSKL